VLALPELVRVPELLEPLTVPELLEPLMEELEAVVLVPELLLLELELELEELAFVVLFDPLEDEELLEEELELELLLELELELLELLELELELLLLELVPLEPELPQAANARLATMATIPLRDMGTPPRPCA
jgi:hypothetical protein